ncbi:hypothetical protein OCO53_25525 [Peribacillus frigoritolerans]|uniref:hypothetical protein n=1 Tax=Peribacillus frigoritolerans TaxID=450367 RepID=UPI0021CFE8FC|nr:hypothetical protein [Peribacillus frigoritolerans]MCU6603804.1 hypothetical protein [Peribacillus frigoritolerans]
MKLLIDLERSIPSGIIFYWNQNKHGYTTNVRDAGRFDDEQAAQIVAEDFDSRTVSIDETVVSKILNR